MRVEVRLTAEELAIVCRPINGEGGWQTLLRRLLARLNSLTGDMSVRTQELDDIERYAYAYGEGGYQERFRAILAAVARVRS